MSPSSGARAVITWRRHAGGWPRIVRELGGDFMDVYARARRSMCLLVTLQNNWRGQQVGDGATNSRRRGIVGQGSTALTRGSFARSQREERYEAGHRGDQGRGHWEAEGRGRYSEAILASLDAWATGIYITIRDPRAGPEGVCVNGLSWNREHFGTALELFAAIDSSIQ